MNKLFIIGNPVKHSFSPIIHNAALKKLNLDEKFSYEKKELKINEIEDFINLIRKGEVFGASVTIPFKEKVIPYLDELTDEADLLQSVNTIYKKDGRILGHNTDGTGFIKSLDKNGIIIENKKIVILGAGGAAKAIAIKLAMENIKKLTIVNRTPERGKIIAELIKKKKNIKIDVVSLEEIKSIIKHADILINATSIGMSGVTKGKTIITKNIIHPGLIVYDVIYNPRKTRLLEEAEKAGARTINGVDMFIYQGAEQFEIFTGKKAPIEIMRNTINGIVNEFDSSEI